MLAVTGLFVAGVCAQTQAVTSEHRLANGLRVIVKEDHRAPTVVSMIWYKAGSMDEAVTRVERALRQGPGGSRVDDVAVDDQGPPSGAHHGFSVRG